MSSSRTTYSERLVFKGMVHYALVVASIVTAIVGWAGALTAAFDNSLQAGQRLVAFVGYGIIVGTLFAIWLLRLSIKVRVAAGELILQLPPLRKTRIELSAIISIEKVEVNAFLDYGGLGVKGSRKDRLFGASGDRGVRIEYAVTPEEVRSVTVLSHNADSLIAALGA